jgi:hypothetical protein
MRLKVKTNNDLSTIGNYDLKISFIGDISRYLSIIGKRCFCSQKKENVLLFYPFLEDSS